jgi:hypothetical protein
MYVHAFPIDDDSTLLKPSLTPTTHFHDISDVEEAPAGISLNKIGVVPRPIEIRGHKRKIVIMVRVI